MSYILTEKLTSTIVIYMILKRLLTKWENWEAYKNGIIDKNGKRIRKPRTSKERESFDILDRFCWSIKRLLTKFIGDSKFVYLFSTAYLMKEELSTIVITNFDKYKEELSSFTATQQQQIFNVLKEMEQNSLLRESNLDLETNIFKISNRTKDILEKYELEKLFEEDAVATTVGDVSQFTPMLGNQKRSFNSFKIKRRSTQLKRRKSWQQSQGMKNKIQ